MNFIEYIQASLAKGTMGSMISVGVYALIGVFAVIGLLFGLKRGFSKTIIRFATIFLSAFGALFCTTGICRLIVNLTNKDGATSVDELIEAYFPGVMNSIPEMIRPLLEEMGTETATIFIMMGFCLVTTPLIFLALFYLFRAITFFLYMLLSGLVGAIEYRKGIASTIFGALFGALQGIVIASVILIPVSGLCGVLEVAKEPIMESSDEPNQMIVNAYDTVLNDLVDNPAFDTISNWGGKAAYESMVTVKINGNKLNMAEEVEGMLEMGVDALPLLTPSFNWTDPTNEQKEAFSKLLIDVDNNELVECLASDVMRGVAMCLDSGALQLPLDGPLKVLIEDILAIFKTSTKDNIVEDLDLVIDLYLIMCEDGILVAFNEGNENVLTELLSVKDESGNTPIDHIINRLNETERSKHVVGTLTKISLSLMQGALGMDEETEQLYEDVKNDLHTVLSHNKSDYETPEEYRDAIKNDLDATLEKNDLSISEDVREHMLDYIEENYSDTSEITDDDINNAILSYYNSYANAKENRGEGEGEGSENIPDLPDLS